MFKFVLRVLRAYSLNKHTLKLLILTYTSNQEAKMFNYLSQGFFRGFNNK